MADLLNTLLVKLSEEFLGVLGGAVFFGSWLLQSWESRLAGTSVVTERFFLMRVVASLLLALEGIRAGSLSLTLLMSATLVLMLYNVYLLRRDTE
ncbi:lipid-A-disaccharide synthase N-terminal domain-containing protein [Primorskyibacter aestuariivivens]|uniref:lipid-A-disaccharide synthase N-terminal domain-containing protein n=1 Tax=Primorskyibacter aestuariivivens TaxID=1888912 RepID=UPI0023010DA1|nr:lipid-A-disaccharide synthase N-terminal domain-containing protein [Primorskyibacter aestuariivivens]MDA7430548.1 lipid-A-disaccharide synthase N-terminal domain-containing protein [Primorskyibacter aestuariivivens]